MTEEVNQKVSNMSSDKPIGPALPPLFRKEEGDEDSDSENGCKYKTKYI